MENNLHPAIPAEIILGTPSLGCKGHGICKVVTQSVANSLPCPSVSALISIVSGKKLRLAFFKSSLPAAVQSIHFGAAGFKVNEPFDLPKWLKAAFQIQTCSVLPGLYKILETDQYLIVDFGS